MNWTKLSAIAEITSSVAVLGTLVYLAIQTQQLTTQTQQNTAAIISNSRGQSLDAQLQLLRMVVDHPVTGFMQERADGDDRSRQLAFELAVFRVGESQWLQYQDGQLDAATWEAYLSVLGGNLGSSTRLRQSWETQVANGGRYDPGFVSAVSDRFAQ